MRSYVLSILEPDKVDLSAWIAPVFPDPEKVEEPNTENEQEYLAALFSQLEQEQAEATNVSGEH